MNTNALGCSRHRGAGGHEDDQQAAGRVPARRPVIPAIASLVLFACCVLTATPSEAARLKGKFTDDVYTAPGGIFTARYQLSGTSAADPCCQRTVSDDVDTRSRVGVMSFSNEYGAINGVIWAPAAPAVEDSAQELSAWLQAVVMPTLRRGSPQAFVHRQETRRVGDFDALLAVTELPGGATACQFDLGTRSLKCGDSVRGLVVFRRGDYCFALMAEMNVLGFFGDGKRYDPANWDAYLPELEAFLAGMTFAKQ